MPSTRTFNGKIYREDTFANNKGYADYLIQNRKASGMLARKVKVKNGWIIYTRRK